MFNEIKTEKDIQDFIDKTNSLHDGYIVGLQYTNDVHTNVDENGYFKNLDATKLILRILVTSIWDTVVEIEFESLWKWQVLNDTYFGVILDTSVSFNDKGYIVWADDVWTDQNDLEGCSFAIAKSMKWRIVE
ncbi:MAG: hypothetical protein E7656_10920 [Ruminococcaceae bacterium]|nr:hypothetical protein [Oscillospiraceae bacterium]